MPANFIRNLTGKTRIRKFDIQLGMVLAFVAGAINAGGFIEVGFYTSHMTGIVSSIADFIAFNQFNAAIVTFIFLLSFILGAFVSTVVINFGRAKEFHGEFALALMLEAGLLLVFGMIAGEIIFSGLVSINLLIILLCFIMGLQNAIITKISNAEIRTTHVTGLATDIGIEIGRILFFSIEGNKTNTQFNKLKLHVSLLLSFLIGGIIGAVSFKFLGPVTATILSLILALLASVPIFDDFKVKAVL